MGKCQAILTRFDGKSEGGPSQARGYSIRFWLWLAVFLGAGAWISSAQTAKNSGNTPVAATPGTDQKEAFNAAARAFQDGFYPRAQREFHQFRQSFPGSPKLSEAVLYEAQAALNQQQISNALELLQKNIPQAGSLSDQYQYWLGEAYLSSSNYQAAARTFAQLNHDYPDSVRLLEAGYGEALARFRMRDWSVVVQLLQDPEGTFQKATQARANDDLVIRGHLLLADALLEEKKIGEAEKVVGLLGQKNLIPEYQWRRQYLTCRILQADDRLKEALGATTNLLALAATTGRSRLPAESVDMQGDILVDLGRWGDAIKVYQQNFLETVPVEYRRRAFLKVIQLTLKTGAVDKAMQQLESFFEQYPGDNASDVGLLAYGELQLKMAFDVLGTNFVESPRPAPMGITNHLQQAMFQFNRLLTNHPNSNLAGQARLNQGWCLWMNNKVAASQVAFKNATEMLPFSADKATAQFKLADAQFYQEDYTNALSNYQAIIDDYVEVSEVRYGLFDRALFQIIRASLVKGDLKRARTALDQLLGEIPESSLVDRAMLLVGQSLGRAGDIAAARELLEDCLKRYSDRALHSEVELTLVRTYVLEQNWPEVIKRYEAWVNSHTNSLLLPRAEFNRAWANYRAGYETNAFSLFTNFVARFPKSELVSQARFWIADFHYNKKDFVNAQLNYQDTNLLASASLGYAARMMAGRAAFAGERWKDAADHFRSLVTDSQCPSGLKVEAYFGLGDTTVRQAGDPTRPQQKFEEAIVVFSKIPQLYPTEPQAANAWGRIGDCYYAMGGFEPKHYDSATNAFMKILSAGPADLGLRSQAEVKLAMVHEQLSHTKTGPAKDALIQIAMDHYLNVVYGTSPVAGNLDQPDPFWLKEAGLAAGKLAEDKQEWSVAMKLYERLLEMLPPSGPALQRRLDRVREQMDR